MKDEAREETEMTFNIPSGRHAHPFSGIIRKSAPLPSAFILHPSSFILSPPCFL
jgi:hypothetical protein